MSMSPVCVIGGSGFIGTRLVARLKSQDQTPLVLLDRVASHDFPELTTVADVRDIGQLRDAMPKGAVLVNLAAEHRDDVQPRSLYWDVNVTGAANICAIAREKSVSKIIFTSTVAVYGFAPIGTDESGQVAPFNDYGRTKLEAEQIFRQWQAEAPTQRTLVIIRPTVVFGERNRGNVFNLLRQIASRRFVMIGRGENRKSLAYVENLAAFVEYSMNLDSGTHVYNFVDKPDYTMNELVSSVYRTLGRAPALRVRMPYFAGYLVGWGADIVASITGKRFAVSRIRIRKFCSNSVYASAVSKTGFRSPVSLEAALERTVRYEFLERRQVPSVFFTE